MNRVAKTLLLCCLAVVMTSTLQAQDEQACMELRSIGAECAGFNADGRPRYVIKFHASISNEDADILYVSSSTGHVGTPVYNLPLDNTGQIFRYVHTGSSLKACFTFTVYAMTEDGRRRLCRIEKCIELPRCPPTCNDVRKLFEARPHLAPNGEDVVLSGVLGFSPFGVGGVAMEVGRGNHRRVCTNTEQSAWEPIRTNILRAGIKGLPDPRIDGSYALWALDSCVRFTQKRPFELVIDLPPACPPISSSNRPIVCTDTVTFCVKYTVKICPELRCDTVICYRIIRKCRVGGSNAGVNDAFLQDIGTLAEGATLTSVGVVSVPNPANEYADVTLTMTEDDPTAGVDIVDVNGNVVTTVATGLSSGETTLPVNLQHVASGMYILRLRHAGGVISEAFRVVK